MTWLAITYWIWFVGVALLIIEDLWHPNANGRGMIILNQRQVYYAILLWPAILLVLIFIWLMDNVGKGWHA